MFLFPADFIPTLRAPYLMVIRRSSELEEKCVKLTIVYLVGSLGMRGTDPLVTTCLKVDFSRM
jgi:hypothetical protein